MPESKDLVVSGEAVPALLQHEIDLAKAFIAEQHAPRTRKGYDAAFRSFSAWCEARGLEALPAMAGTVCAYLAGAAAEGAKVATLEHRIAAIRYAHVTKSLSPPTQDPAVKATMRGIRRVAGVKRQGKAAATLESVKAMAAHCADDIGGLRDRALLLVGFAGAFRRGELVCLNVEDIEFVSKGALIQIRRSKTDQEAAGRTKPILAGSGSVCPINALRSWMAASDVRCGALFRRLYKGGVVSDKRLSPQSVALVVKKYAAAAGLPAADLSGHSLRSGFLTSAAERKARREKMKDVSLHRSDQALETYIKPVELFEDHAATGMF